GKIHRHADPAKRSRAHGRDHDRNSEPHPRAPRARGRDPQPPRRSLGEELSPLLLAIVLLPRVEAQGLLAWDQGIHGGFGPGAGARISFPISSGNRVGNFSDELAFTAGAAYLHFECPYGKNCADAHTIYVPIALAWSFAIHPRVSVFVEPGIAAFISAFRETCPMDVTCAPYDHFGLRPVVDLGIAAHLGPVHIVFRAGFPTFSLGLGV